MRRMKQQSHFNFTSIILIPCRYEPLHIRVDVFTHSMGCSVAPQDLRLETIESTCRSLRPSTREGFLVEVVAGMRDP
jgi:hypothetical protein